MKRQSSGENFDGFGGKSRQEGKEVSFSRNFSSGYSSDGGSSIDVPASKRKYVPSLDGSSDMGKTKKRFVWPESLHKDFISAVFDVGLKAANSKILLEMLAGSSPSVTVDSLKASLQKYRLFRDRSKTDHVSYYDVWLRENGNGKISPRSSDKARQLSGQTAADVAAQRQAREAARQAAAEQAQAQETAANLRKQIDIINKAIASQTQFLSTLKASISKQTKIHSQLVSKLALIDPSAAVQHTLDTNSRHGSSEKDDYRDESVVHMSESLAQSITAALDLQGKALSSKNAILAGGPVPARAELQIMSEMRSHMDMHRQLLMRREDQLSMHGGVGAGASSSSSAASNGGLGVNVFGSGVAMMHHHHHHHGQTHDNNSSGGGSDNNSDTYPDGDSEGSSGGDSRPYNNNNTNIHNNNSSNNNIGGGSMGSAAAAMTSANDNSNSSNFNPDLGWDADDPLDTNLFSFLLEPYGGPNE